MRHSRTIPKALPQPIQPKMQIATKEELFDAMRAAIIETMQNKEKLKRRRMRREEEKQKKMQMKSKAKLPKELLKHITGKEQSIEELHESWFNRIKATIEINNIELIGRLAKYFHNLIYGGMGYIFLTFDL